MSKSLQTPAERRAAAARRRRRRDSLAVIGGILFFLLIFVLIGLGIWMRVAAPCDAIDWLPASETPARCFR